MRDCCFCVCTGHVPIDDEAFSIPHSMGSLDFDLGSEQVDLSPMSARAGSLQIGYGIASLAADVDDGQGQGIALVVDAEVRKCVALHAHCHLV